MRKCINCLIHFIKMKDPLNCPICEAEEKGSSSGWGMSPEGVEQMRRTHERDHMQHCDKCGQSIK